MLENKCILFSIGLISLNIFFIKCSDFIKEKPEWFQTCRINEPGYFKCSTESVQKMMNHVLKEGIPEITAKLGTFDPMKIGEVTFKQNNNQAVQLNAKLENMLVTGLSELKINESRVYKKDYSWRTKMFLPMLHLAGTYKMNGKVLLLPLSGNGKFVMEIDSLNILLHTKSFLYEKEGFVFSNVSKVRVELDAGNMRVNFENIFNGNNKEIEESTNDFFNANWREFFEALRPLISETVEHLLLRIMKVCFDVIPSNFLIEDIATLEQLYVKTINA